MGCTASTTNSAPQSDRNDELLKKDQELLEKLEKSLIELRQGREEMAEALRSSSTATRMVSSRPLTKLPKASLHLHWGEAMVRRSTLLECAHHERWRAKSKDGSQVSWQAQARAEAELMITQMKEAKNEEYAKTWIRRLDKVSNEDPDKMMEEVYGPTPLDGGTEEQRLEEDVRKLDRQAQVDGRVLREAAWDREWVTTRLLLVLSKDGDEKAWEERVLRELYEDASAEGVVWVEIAAGKEGMIDPLNGTVDPKKDVEWRRRLTVWCRLEAEYVGRVSVRFIHMVPKEPKCAHSFIHWMKSSPFAKQAFVGVGLWGREYPATMRQKSFQICQKECLPALNVHAGENCMQCAAPEGGKPQEELERIYSGPGNVRAALAAGASRIGHGIEAVKDPHLVAELAARSSEVCLEICLLSNRCLGYCPEGLKHHPLLQLHAKGVACCLCSDDPAFFGSPNGHGLVREFLVARHIMGFDDKALANFARNSIRHSRAPQSLKQRALADINSWLALPESATSTTTSGPRFPYEDTDIAMRNMLESLGAGAGAMDSCWRGLGGDRLVPLLAPHPHLDLPPIRLIDAHWLVQLWLKGGRIELRQRLEKETPEAFISIPELLHAGAPHGSLPIITVSCASRRTLDAELQSEALSMSVCCCLLCRSLAPARPSRS